MGSQFDEMFAASREQLQATVGETVTYRPMHGDARPVVVTFHEGGPSGIRYAGEGREHSQRATAWIATGGAQGVANPGEGDTLVRNGVTWTVRGTGQAAGGMIELILEARTPVDGAGRGYWRE